MNCKPGDLAVCIRSNKGRTSIDPLGHLCQVLSLAPTSQDFLLPDGQMQAPFGAGFWVVEWDSEMPYPTTVGVRWTKFGICHDRNLRPIRDPGDDATDETLTWLPVPSRERETV